MDPSDDEKIAQGRFIYAEVMELAKRFQKRGIRVADLIWVAATICEMFMIASKERDPVPITEEQILKVVSLRLAAMEAAGVATALSNRLLIDRTINDLNEELKSASPFKA